MKYISGNVSVLNLNNLHFKFTQRINLINADNGKGKTTFLKCLCNLIKFNGEILDDKEHRIATDNISFFFSGDEFLESDMTVIQNWEYMLGGQIKDNVLFTGFGLNTQSDVLVKELSEGNKQKLRLAITLNRKKKYYVLDEPTTYLDEKSIECLANYLKNNDDSCIYIISTNDVTFATLLSDNIVNVLR